jgi:hypothetical protein
LVLGDAGERRLNWCGAYSLLVVKSLGMALVVIMERSISVKPSCVDIRYVTKPTMLIAKMNSVLQSLFLLNFNFFTEKLSKLHLLQALITSSTIVVCVTN